ncbi:MAG: hypothetical protein HZC37_02465 [Burkholderiales bacterium]|nr:hypothetical protein [Burkholderiales bacterium]
MSATAAAGTAAAAAVGATRPPLLDASGLRLPREPYPGLRPFLDFEAALLFGRQRQVREIIERLAATQFVAVLGGSGSGKSSLIHAGVTPELRSYGIPGAGDLWLPMVCTPGTNVSAADQAARRHSPVTRLVRRFAKLLKSRGSDEADDRRLDEMAEVFRQEGGFARLLQAYGHELDVPPGPDPADARVLFVIDQFEEVFHPTNKAVAGGPDEAGVLVERLLDHFYRPHPHCYVVITMRSEHLNDCASYLELPDAINKSSFLVRRLDADDLREAIVGPAQRFLRLMARQHAGTPTGAKLPAQVEFEPAVLQRLLRDVTAITHDPDHLPLLQHMLARLWQAALERDDDMDALVPARITPADLARAVNASRPGGKAASRPAVAEGVNTLRESVHNWPERIYLDHDEANRKRLDTLLRRLALKDPNTGHYSQQRIEAGAAAALLGLPERRGGPAGQGGPPGRPGTPGLSATSGPSGPTGPQELRRLLSEGFLGTVDYLFWDAEDPARVTIKVSHESFIRGWRRFKLLVDAEAVQYEEYLAVLRRCAAWAEHEHNPEDLLGSGELRRVSSGSVQKRRAARQPFDDWLRLLALDREGARLLPYAKELPAYIDESERVERRRRARRVLWPVLLVSVTGITLGLALPTLFALLIEGPTIRRAELMLDAFGSTESAEVNRHYATRAEAQASLRRLLDAAALVDGARAGTNTTFGRTSVRLINALDGIALVRRQGDFLQGVLSQSEPVVIDKLREVLGTSPLLAVPLPNAATTVPDAAPQAFAGECSVPEITEPSRGRVIVAAPSRDGSDRPGPRRALFIPDARGDTANFAVYAATWSAAEGLCRLGPLMMVLDPESESHAVLDSSLRHLVVLLAQGPANEREGVMLQTISWRIGAGGEAERAQRGTVVTLDDPALVRRLREVAGADRLRVVTTWGAPAGRVLDMGGEGWRVVSWQSRRLRTAMRTEVREPDFRLAVPAAAGTPCAVLAATLPPVQGWRMRMLDAGSLCLAVYRARQPGKAGDAGVAEGSDELGVWAYPRPLPGTLSRLDKRPLLPLAAVSPFATVRAANGEAEEPEWALGVRGAWSGWLVLRTAAPAPIAGAAPGSPAAEGDAVRLYGLPLTTCALWRFGQALLPPDAAHPSGPATCTESP